MTRPDLTWTDTANCVRPEHQGLPWLAEPEQVRPAQLARLRLVCAACPVAAACDEYANRNHVTAGFWAGTHRTPREAGQLTLDLGQLGESA